MGPSGDDLARRRRLTDSVRDLITDFVAAGPNRRTDPCRDFARRFKTAKGGGENRSRKASPTRMNRSDLPGPGEKYGYTIRGDHRQRSLLTVGDESIASPVLSGVCLHNFRRMNLCQPRHLGLGWRELTHHSLSIISRPLARKTDLDITIPSTPMRPPRSLGRDEYHLPIVVVGFRVGVAGLTLPCSVSECEGSLISRTLQPPYRSVGHRFRVLRTIVSLAKVYQA